MKRFLSLLILGLGVYSLQAQTFTDAINFSVNEYGGTARSLALGNAMTAVGGDLGSIGINPAGGGVAPYSQLTLTPSLNFAFSTSGYAAVSGTDPFSNNNPARHTRFQLPNIGLSFQYETGQRYGLKSMSFGLVSNSTANFNSKCVGGGTNDQTTYSGYVASQAKGYKDSVLGSYGSYASFSAPWECINAYRSNMIGTLTGKDDVYAGAAEVIYPNGDITIGGPINQTFGYQSYGSKNDMAINWSCNISDRLFLGANLVIQILEMQQDQYIKEYAVNPAKFPVRINDVDTQFDNLRSRFSYHANGSGLYAKFGAIYVPGNGLRIGGAIQTPTAMTIKEVWKYAGETHFTNNSVDASDTSSDGQYEYRFRAPWRFNLGVAYTYSNLALFSLDYEMCDYKTMRFRSMDAYYDNEFNNVNQDIKDFGGIAHYIRAGAEVKPLPQFALRAGYNLATSPEYYYESNVRKHVSALTHACSFGIGYSSDGSFFADLAARYTFHPTQYITPYYDYVGVKSPELETRCGALDLVLTLGFRF